jgi:hypothetical protein
MNIKQYQLRLKELLAYLYSSDWVKLNDIDAGGIHITMNLLDLTNQPIRILLMTDRNAVNDTITVSPALEFPHIMHPNICRNTRVMCINPPVGDEDADWDASLVLLVWAIAESLMNPNFDDMLMDLIGSGRGPAVTNIKDYLEQFQNHGAELDHGAQTAVP